MRYLLKGLTARGGMRLSVCLLFFPSALRCNPSGGVVVQGMADISVNGLDPSLLQITQSSDKAIINWQDFSISAGETTQFIQPSQMAAILNRVVSGNSSILAGRLIANGKVIVVNQNGIIVTSSGVIDAAGGVVLSTLDIADGDFMNGMDDSFLGTTAAGVTNFGTIMSAGGDVILLGNFINNANSGIIGAPDGVVALGAGGNIVVHAQGGNKISIKAAGAGAATGVNNSGTITGAAAELKAHGNVYALAINNSGIIRATGSQTIDGRVMLISRSTGGGAGGDIENSGQIHAGNVDDSGGLVLVEGNNITMTAGSLVDVSGSGAAAGGEVTVRATGDVELAANAVMNADGATGGTVSLAGEADVTMAGVISALGNDGAGGSISVAGARVVIAVQSSMDVSGLTGGGRINVGGGFRGGDANFRNSDSTVVGGLATLRADAVNSGDAGVVVVWSNGNTIFSGEITARALGQVGRGGLIEVAARQDLQMAGAADVSAASGQSGTVLLGASELNVGTAGTDIPIARLNEILQRNNSNVILVAEGGGITFDSINADIRDTSVQWNTDASLAIFASEDVRFLNSVRTAGAGAVNVIAGWTGLPSEQILSGGAQAAWRDYVNGTQAGSFGAYGGSVYINDEANNRQVEVGSRYGNTNVAGRNVFITGGVGGAGRWAQLGFRDNGQVFWFNEATHRIDGPGVQAGRPLVGMAGVNETTSGGEAGVLMFNDLSADGSDLLGDASGVVHFLRYADDFASATDGNWWWRTLDARDGGSVSGIGNNLPEMGAGISDELLVMDAFGGLLNSSADINIEASGALIVRSGNAGDSYNSNYAQVGHGGNSRDWQNINLTRATNGERDAYSSNWGSGNSFTTAIGRLAPVYGDINIRTGLLRDSVSGVLEPVSGFGLVWLQAVSGGDTTGRLQNNYAQIGHMGTGQGGSAIGAINIQSGGAVRVESAFGRRSSAVIGHAIDDTDDLRRGKGLMSVTGITPDGKLGGGQQKQFRVFALNAEQTSASLGRGDLAGYMIADLGVGGIYGGDTEVTGAGADVFSNLQGDITVNSVTGDVSVLGAVGDPQIVRERMTNSPARIGHGALASGSEYRLNVMGDIAVSAARDIMVVAGNGRMGSAQIGFYGGARDDTNDFTIGNIRVEAVRNLVIEGGGRTPLFPRSVGGSSTDYQAFAMIGHGGNEADSKFKNGDITVSVGGDLTMTSGAYGGAFVQIGHGGEDAEGQVGGEYTRTIQIADVGSDGERNVNWMTSNLGMGDMQLEPNMTANVVVTVAGDIVLEHLPTNNPLVVNARALDDPDTPLDESNPTRMKMDNSYVLIGHGGANTTESTANDLRRYWDKTGSVEVSAGGSLTMQNGGGNNGWYTRIGHGANRGDRMRNGREAKFGGNVMVTVGADLMMNANWAPNEYAGIPIPPGGNGAFKDFAAGNPVAIGNGGTRDGSFIDFEGDVTVMVAGDATMLSGKGLEAAYVQIGNGGAGSLSIDSTVNDTGKFTGDILVEVAGALVMEANPDGVVYVLDPTNANNFGLEVKNSYVLIGNGGAFWETRGNDVATMDGQIRVRVGADLTLNAGTRVQAPEQDGDSNWATLSGSFAQIGNANSGVGAHGRVSGTANGDVFVQVGNDLTMEGGRGEVDFTTPNVGAYVQIGNGGAGMDGVITGAIELKVGNDLSAAAGQGVGNSYAKIGNGDWMRAAAGLSGTGTRAGDIRVYVGNTASFDQVLIGHVDTAVSAARGEWNTYIGVSRNDPFYGGAGQLISNDRSVFSSGSDIVLGELRFYLPGRSNNQLAVGTMLNGEAFVGNEAGVDFVLPTQRVARGVMASFQRDDEIYLQPDWWADADGQGGQPFPEGSLAEVEAVGGRANLVNAVAGGVLGGGTVVNAQGESTYLGFRLNIRDVLNYTLYYDAIAPEVLLVLDDGGSGVTGGAEFAPSVVPPVGISSFVPDVDLYNVLFFNQSGADLFGYTERDDLIRGDVADGGGDIVGGLRVQRSHGLFGVVDGELTPEEKALERRRRARYRPQVNNGGRTFYVYDVNSRQYSSYRMFGAPNSPRP